MLTRWFGGYERGGHGVRIRFLTMRRAFRYGRFGIFSSMDPYTQDLTGRITFIPGKILRRKLRGDVLKQTSLLVYLFGGYGLSNNFYLMKFLSHRRAHQFQYWYYPGAKEIFLPGKILRRR